MARINIEDSLFKDARFFNLCIKLQGQQHALGTLIWAFMVAQKFYLDESNDRLIPLHEWKRQLCSDALIECGFAEVRDNGVYVSGSEDQFSWLVQRVEAGRKGGLSGKQRNKRSLTSAKRVEAVAKPPYSLLSSLTQSLNSNSAREGGVGETPEVPCAQAGEAQPPPQASPRLRIRPAPPPRGAILEFKGDPLREEFLCDSTDVVQRAWISAYSDLDWIRLEIAKARAWIEANPKKRPKNNAAFLSNWFARGWEQHRKTIPSNKPEDAPGESSFVRLARQRGYA